MKASNGVLLVAASALLFMSGAARAADLDNKDNRTYQLKIRSGPGSTTNASINGHTMKKGVCSSCELEVVGAGTVKVSGNMTVVISGGRLSVRK